MSLFTGLSAFPLTPSGEDARLIHQDFEVLLDRIIDAQVGSIGVLGSTGGYAYLPPETRMHVAEAAIHYNAGRIPILIGVGAMRTDDAVQLAKHAEATGADGVFLAPISYTPLTEDEAFAHYKAIADAIELPMCIYNNPSTTGFKFSVELIQKLAKIQNIKSIKMPLPANGDFVGEMNALRGDLPDDFTIGYSGDWGCAGAMAAGADVWYSAIGGLFPKETLALSDAARSGDAQKTSIVEAKFKPFWDLMRAHGSYRVLYTAANQLGLTKAQPHLPILPLNTEGELRVAMAIDALKI